MKKITVTKNCLEAWKMKKKSGNYKRQKAKQIANQFAECESNMSSLVHESTPQQNVTPIIDIIEDEEMLLESRASDNGHDITNHRHGEWETMSNADDDDGERKSERESFSSSGFDIELIQSKLSCWAIKTNVNHTQLKGLLDIWNNHVPLPNLPKDPRTLLKTPRTLNIISDGKQKYWHYGLQKSLLKLLSLPPDLPDHISLIFNVDGLPISESSKQQFWPILYKIHEMKDLPAMTIGIYYGYEKPSSLEQFLRPFVDEMKLLLETGIIIGAKHVGIKIRCFVADSPARAFLKAVVNFNATEGCLKCTVEGYRSTTTNATIFPNLKAPKRTDQDFRAGVYVDHYKATTPLLELPIDMIADFPIGDVLHLIDLGITKSLIKSWSKGFFTNIDTKWSAATTNKISQFLVSCEKPAEIHRKIRGIDVLAFWKGTEFRTFLLYTSIVVLKDHMPGYIYNHFLFFFCAITIVSSKLHLETKTDIAEQLIETFLQHFKVIYGKDYFFSNMHNLTHLLDDVKRFGPLESFAAYPFESKLFKIKTFLRSGNQPLAQVGNRIIEEEQHFNEKYVNDYQKNITYHKLLTYRCEYLDNLYKSYETFEEVKLKNYLVSTSTSNKWILTNKLEVVEVKCIVVTPGTNDCAKRIQILGFSIKKLEEFFNLPFPSSALYIYKAKHELNAPRLFQLRDIKCKLFKLYSPSQSTSTNRSNYDSSDDENESSTQIFDKNNLIFIPLLHTLIN